MGRASLAEKPKVEELQMDWLRSEDLKEEEDVTAPFLSIAGYPLRRSSRTDEAYHWGMQQLNLEHGEPHPSGRSVPTDMLLREEPDDDEEEEEDEEHNSNGDDDGDEGYSE